MYFWKAKPLSPTNPGGTRRKSRILRINGYLFDPFGVIINEAVPHLDGPLQVVPDGFGTEPHQCAAQYITGRGRVTPRRHLTSFGREGFRKAVRSAYSSAPRGPTSGRISLQKLDSIVILQKGWAPLHPRAEREWGGAPFRRPREIYRFCFTTIELITLAARSTRSAALDRWRYTSRILIR